MASDLLTLHRLLIVWEATALLRHDLRNKLATIRNAGFYLQRKVEAGAADLVAADPRIGTFFGLVRSEADDAALIVDRLPRLVSEPVLTAFDLADVAADALAALQAPAGIAIERYGSGAPARGCREELAVAVFCLVENALEAVAAHGGTVRIGCEVRGDRAVLAVDDDGPGLGDLAARALEPFVTTRPGHLGLGLAIARRVATRSGGSLALLAAEGGGLRVELAVPGSA